MSTPHFCKKLDFCQIVLYNNSQRVSNNGGRLAPLRREVIPMSTYVTYESLFAFTQILLTLTVVVTGIITLIIAIIKLNNKRKNNRPTRQSCGYLMT